MVNLIIHRQTRVQACTAVHCTKLDKMNKELDLDKKWANRETK